MSSEAERLARIIWKLEGIKATVDQNEEFFEMAERELVDEIINTVLIRVRAVLERTHQPTARIAKKWSKS